MILLKKSCYTLQEKQFKESIMKEYEDVKIQKIDLFDSEQCNKCFYFENRLLAQDYFEKLIRYIKVVTVVMKYKIFVFVNLRSYLSDLQMQKLIQEAIHQEVKLIFVENCVKDCMEGGLRYIIDRDQCEIY